MEMIAKYGEIYKKILKLQPNDTLQLILGADTEDEKEFWEVVGDFLLQKAQKEVVSENKF